MKCNKCKQHMEYNYGVWECECGNEEAVLDAKTSKAFLISDEQDFYVTNEQDIHLN